MRILLVQPAVNKKKSFFDCIFKKIWPMQPMTILQLAAVTPKNHELTCVDETFQKIEFDQDYDIVGITCNTPLALKAYEIADRFRNNGAKVALGGVHPSALLHEAKQHADSVVIGEGEISWPILISDFERKRNIKSFYRSKLIDASLIPPPDYTYSNGFKLTMRVQATRGCPNKCEFCSLHLIEGNTLRKRPIKHVINEIRSHNCKWITFVDSSLTLDPSYTKTLFRQMQPLRKKFACFGNINVLEKDNELLKLAKKAGCIAWEIGLESISQKSLNEAGKKTNKVSKYKKAIKNIKNHNMAVVGSFVFGFDGDTADIFDKTLDVIHDLELDSVSCNILTPYPGTRLYEKLEKENRILSRDWSKYDLGHVVFEPRNMSREELFHGTRKIVKSIYNPLSQFKMNRKSMPLGFSPFIGTTIRNYCNVDFYKKIYLFKKPDFLRSKEDIALCNTTRS